MTGSHTSGKGAFGMALCERNPPITGEFPSQRSVTRGFDVFFLSAPEQTVE